MATRKFGYLKDPEDHRDHRFGVLAVAGGPAPPPRASLRAYAPPVLDQGDLSSCVAHAVAYAVATCHRAHGQATQDLLSRLFVYWNSRSYHKATTEDAGTYLRMAVKAFAALGFCPEQTWPYVEEKVFERPSIAAYRAAYDQRVVTGYFRIDGVGSAKVDAVKRAIASRFPVVFGTPVSRAFLDAGPRDVFGPPDLEDVVGGHAMCALEYDGITFRGPQSWGMGYGDGGWWAMNDRYVAETWDDVWALHMVPVYSGEAA